TAVGVLGNGSSARGRWGPAPAGGWASAVSNGAAAASAAVAVKTAANDKVERCISFPTSPGEPTYDNGGGAASGRSKDRCGAAAGDSAGRNTDTARPFRARPLMFRSVRFYSITSPWPDSEQALAEKLAAAAFKPCGPYSERSAGWEPPAGDGGLLARRVAGADLLRLRSQTRVLPAAAVNEALELRIEEYRAKMREEPGRRAKRKLKEQTRDELLPK